MFDQCDSCDQLMVAGEAVPVRYLRRVYLASTNPEDATRLMAVHEDCYLANRSTFELAAVRPTGWE